MARKPKIRDQEGDEVEAGIPCRQCHNTGGCQRGGKCEKGFIKEVKE